MSEHETTEIPAVREFFPEAPEPTNFQQAIGTLVDDTEVKEFKSGDRVVKGRIAVQRNGANGADFISLDDFEEDWYGGHRQSALEGAKKGATVMVSGEFRKDSTGTGDNRRWYDKIRVKYCVVSDGDTVNSAMRAAIQQAIANVEG